MKEQTKALFSRFRHLILYGIIGSFSAGLDLAIYTVLVSFVGMSYLMANCISVLAGITSSFCLNRNYNFRVRDNVVRRFAIFLAVGLFGLLLSNIILYICIDIFCVHKIIAKLLSIILVVGIQFLLNKFITFKPSIPNEQN